MLVILLELVISESAYDNLVSQGFLHSTSHSLATTQLKADSARRYTGLVLINLGETMWFSKYGLHVADGVGGGDGDLFPVGYSSLVTQIYETLMK